MKRYEESVIQETVVYWVKCNYPGLLFTCAPATAKSVQQGVRNKRMGLLKGWPDLFFAEPRKGFHGLFVELKTSTGRIAPEQRDLLACLDAEGYKTYVCWSAEEAIEKISGYLQLK